MPPTHPRVEAERQTTRIGPPPEPEARGSVAPVRFHAPSFLLGGLLVGLAAGLIFLWARAPQPPPIVLHTPPTPAPTATITPTSTPGPIVVYVSGAVMQPGLYSVPADARVGDALDMAGGFDDHAASDALNLAERLWDGARVHVGSEIDQIISEETSSETVQAGVSGAPLPTATPDTVAGSAGNPAGQVNLNTASQGELESLPGIGPARAQAIMEHRPYARVDEITRVPGIGDGILAQLRDLVTVE